MAAILMCMHVYVFNYGGLKRATLCVYLCAFETFSFTFYLLKRLKSLEE